MTEKLLTRDDFREGVFARDNNKCVFCEKAALDAHHIIERRLWADGGYYMANGASVCQDHHILCEETTISVEDVRIACGITKIIVPQHLYPDTIYDKWGNPCLPNGTRLKGDLFNDESVQKILKQGGVLDLFVDYVKYPRTYHLPWSDNVNDDDRMMKSLDSFIGKEIVITEKMDGENTNIYSDYLHARSVDGKNHHTRAWVKQFASTFQYDIPKGWRVCGENLFATHSIKYEKLPSFFMGFSIWNEKNVCIDWDSTLEWFSLLGIEPPPVLYRGIWDENIVKGIWDQENWEHSEGYVVRLAEEIPYSDFRFCVGKYVRKDHVSTVKHWMHGQITENNILKD